MIRVGIGQDSHPFSDDIKKECILGGIAIHNVPGFEGNSDGDVVVHALCAAIEQALGRKSFSTYSDDMCEQGISDSKEYLKVAVEHMQLDGYKLNNIGIAIECETPRILPIADKMKEALAPILRTDEKNIGISATTGEGMTAFGRGEGVQAFVIISLIKDE